MNKKILSLTLLLTITTLVSCNKKPISSSQELGNSSINSLENSSFNEVVSNITSLDNSYNQASSNSSISASSSMNSSSNEVIETKLDTPKLSIDNETGIVSWEKIEGATHYNYVINDGEVLTTVNTTITLNDQENISVQASNDTDCSEFSSCVTYYDTSDIEIEKVRKGRVYFHDSNVSPLEVELGSTISRPTDPIKINHTFDDWYKDPFYQEKFDFSEPIDGRTIIYANWIPNDLVKDTYYWIKCSPLITSNISSSSTGWKFVPLKLNEGQTEFKEYYTTVQVSGASETNPAQFIAMDGFSDDSGRTYWKKGTEDFTIKTDGIYNVYFSAEHQYAKDIHILVGEASNTGVSYLLKQQSRKQIVTPIVEVNNETNKCSWNKDNNAAKYEVIIDNGEIKTTTSNTYSIPKGSHVSVRSVYADGSKSNWSIPKANINYIIIDPNDDGIVYAYFKDSKLPATKLNKGDVVDNIVLANETHRNFEGWYLEPSLKTKVTFPYIVNKNTVFYPKWTYGINKEYYILVDSLGNKVGGFLWNYDNYDFLEYELKYKLLDAKTYYIKSLDGSVTYSTFSIGKKNTYSIYFSEEYLWEEPNNPEEKRNIYIRHDKKEIYFTNSLYWSKVNAYYWNNSTSVKEYSWPGTSLSKVGTNDMGQDIYKVSIDIQYDYVIFNNGSGVQTVDIPIGNITNNAFYVNDSKDGSGHYKVGSWTYKG